MKVKIACSCCGSRAIEYIGSGKCFCSECNQEREAKEVVVESPYERTRSSVYATGNRWAIENFNATHH